MNTEKFRDPAAADTNTESLPNLGERAAELAQRISDGRLPLDQIRDYVHGMLLAAYMDGQIFDAALRRAAAANDIASWVEERGLNPDSIADVRYDIDFFKREYLAREIRRRWP